MTLLFNIGKLLQVSIYARTCSRVMNGIGSGGRHKFNRRIGGSRPWPPPARGYEITGDGLHESFHRTLLEACLHPKQQVQKDFSHLRRRPATVDDPGLRFDTAVSFIERQGGSVVFRIGTRMIVLALLASAGVMSAVEISPAIAQDNKMNFKDRKAHVINNSPFLELSDFKFSNAFASSRFALSTDLKWKNIGTKPITAFEVVTMYYDPFNRPLRRGGRWLVPGTDSGNWTALAPGKTGSDGTRAYDTEHAFTAFVFVRSVRLDDGTVWTYDDNAVSEKIKALLPAIKEIGNLEPDEKGKS